MFTSERFGFWPSVLFRVDAGREVALGHLKRCVSLARKLSEKGAAVAFLTAEDDFTTRYLMESGFTHRILRSRTNSDDDLNLTMETADELGAKIMVIDSYGIDASYRKRLMDSGIFTVSMDDMAGRDMPSHMIINGNLNAETLRYKGTEGVSLCLGIRYLILHPEFWNPDRKAETDKFSNILITMGGIDHYDLSSRILLLMEGLEPDFDITVIAGPYYENMDSINRQVSRMKKTVEIVSSPPSLYPYIKRCSMAFSAGGQTLYELAVMGRPAVGIALWENQAGNVSELSTVGAIMAVVYSDDKHFDSKLKELAMRLISDRAERQRMSMVASSLIDGRGAERAGNAIFEAYEKWASINSGKEKTWQI